MFDLHCWINSSHVRHFVERARYARGLLFSLSLSHSSGSHLGQLMPLYVALFRPFPLFLRGGIRSSSCASESGNPLSWAWLQSRPLSLFIRRSFRVKDREIPLPAGRTGSCARKVTEFIHLNQNVWKGAKCSSVVEASGEFSTWGNSWEISYRILRYKWLLFK